VELEERARSTMKAIQPREQFHDQVWESFSVHFIEDKHKLEGANGKLLRAYFKSVVEEDGFPAGFRRIYFPSQETADPKPYRGLIMRIWNGTFDDFAEHMYDYPGFLCADATTLFLTIVPCIIQAKQPRRILEESYRLWK
jgi:hypothetical protein